MAYAQRSHYVHVHIVIRWNQISIINSWIHFSNDAINIVLAPVKCTLTYLLISSFWVLLDAMAEY